jgi:hypothetical protein
MIKVDRCRLLVSLVLVLLIGSVAVGSADAGLFGLFKSRKKGSTPVVTQSLVIFPFDNAVGVKLPETFGEDVASALHSMMFSNDHYWVYFYTDRLAPIQRAKDDGGIKPQETTPPFSEDREKSVKLARLLAADYLLVGSVEDYKMDIANKSAQVTLSVNLVSTKTGKVVKTLLVTGRTPEGSSNGEEEDVRALAAGDAVAKLKVQLLEEESSTKESDETAEKSRGGDAAPVSMPAAQSAK